MTSPFLEPLIAIGLPIAAAVVAAVPLWLVRRGRPLGSPAPLGWEGAAMATALAAALIAVRGWHGVPPGNVNDWPGPLAGLALALALAAATPWRWFAPLALVTVVICAPLILTVPLRSWSLGQAALWLPAIGLPWLLLIAASRSTAERLPDAALPAWGAAVAVSALIANNAGSSSTAMHLGGAAAATGAWAVLRMLVGDVIRPASLAVALAVCVPLFWLLVHTLTDNVPVTALIPLAAAPLGAWIAWPLRQRRWPAAILAAVVAGGIAAIAAALVSAPPPAAMGW